MGGLKTAIQLVVAAGLVAGCNESSTGGLGGTPNNSGGSATVFSYSYDDSAFAQSYMNLQDFSAYQVAAQNIRDSAAFAIQSFKSSAWGRSHFSLSSANVEYAHAVGLTGAGQTIAVIDEGFQFDGTIVNEELLNKAITRFGSVYNPSPSDPCLTDSTVSCHGAHGTAVAAIAASDGSTGDIIGVAPGADLHLAVYSSDRNMADATLDAAALGAIVQNNSWGYDSYDGTQANFNTLLSSSDAVDYVDALKVFAQTGVIVFATSNDSSRSNYDMSTALPDFVPELEENFLAVGNVIPLYGSSGDLSNAIRLSAACLEAARYCLVAEGTVMGPSVEPGGPAVTDRLAQWSGTSFAAPQVSGAVALLAEAFPTLSAQELRARLLASADNSFFEHDGYVEFTSNVRHGFDDEFGHGMLDVGAALLPIGGRYIPISNGSSVSVGQATIVSNGAAGSAISRALSQTDIVFEDGLGAGFETSAEILSAYAKPSADPVQFAETMGQHDGAVGSGFADYLTGASIGMNAAGHSVSMLLPEGGAGQGNLGLSYWNETDEGLRFGVSGLLESGSYMGISGGGMTDAYTMQSAIGLAWRGSIAPGLELDLGARAGVAVPLAGESALYDLGTSGFTEFGASLAFANLAQTGDRLRVHASLPQAVSAGSAGMILPIARSATGVNFDRMDVSLSPEARQLDLTVDYTRPLGGQSEAVMSARYIFNNGHVAGNDDGLIGMGWRYRF
jgi:hypothetical protein